MFHFCIDSNDNLLGLADKAGKDTETHRWVTRHHIDSFEQAERYAAQASANDSGRVYLAIDSGEHCWPRYDVVEAPRVGDEVSMGFNGDYYPRGTVAKVSANYRVVTTSDGHRFYRRRLSGAWLHKGQWYLAAGHIRAWNPEF